MPAIQRQQGVALAMLLWMVAGLSLLVSGTMYLSRTDVQLTSYQLEQAKAHAAAVGAGHLLMRDMLINQNQMQQDGSELQAGAVFTRQYQLGDLTLQARARSASGFISLNSASVELLTDLFLYAGGLPQEDAGLLAEQVELWRASAPPEIDPALEPAATDGSQGQGQFRVLEDLLRVPGMTRQIYDRVSPAVTVSGGSSGVNPVAAGPAALLVISRGDQALVDFIQESRQDERPDLGTTTGLETSYLSADSSTTYCLEIDVMTSANRVFQQRIWVESGSGGALPWRFTRVMPITMRSSIQGNIDAR